MAVFGWTSILGFVVGAVDHDLRRPERVAAMEQVDLRGEAGQVGRLLERGVTAAHDGDLAVAEEEAVARGAGRHAAAAKAGLRVESEPQRRRAGRDDDRLCPVFDAAGPDAERALGEIDAVDVDVDQARPEALGLGAERGHQVGALDAVGEAGVVLDVAGEHQLPARGRARDDDRLEIGPRGIDRGGQAGRSGPDDHDLGLDRALVAGQPGWTAGTGDGGRLGAVLGAGRRVDDRDRQAAEWVVSHDLTLARVAYPGGVWWPAVCRLVVPGVTVDAAPARCHGRWPRDGPGS